jgi:ribosomal protein S18 acetylase RimI-like enzyme
MPIRVVHKLPSAAEFNELRNGIGWIPRATDVVSLGLENSLFSVCALDGDRVVGHARVIGDGSLYFYLQDVMVLASHQRQGIGSMMMAEVMAYLDRAVPPGSFVGLMAAAGARSFYERYGFEDRPAGSES